MICNKVVFHGRDWFEPEKPSPDFAKASSDRPCLPPSRFRFAPLPFGGIGRLERVPAPHGHFTTVASRTAGGFHIIKVYWGSSATVQPGQPKILEMSSLSLAQQMEMAGHMRMSPGMLLSGGSGGDYFYREGWTTGYWPDASDPGVVPSTASLAGRFTLNTNFAGNASLDVPSGVNFLPAIQLQSPDLGSVIDFSNPVDFKWKPVVGAVGQYATIFGMEGRNTLILWSSSEIYADELLADMGYSETADVQDAVEKKLFMPSWVGSMTAPAGIFQNAEFSVLNMSALGDGSQPAPFVQTQSTLTLMLGGKNGVRPDIGDNG